jgi:serine protease Do
VEDLTPRLARQLELPSDAEGVVVSNIEPLSPADQAGFMKGDLIIEVNRTEVSDVRNFMKEMKSASEEGDTILFLVNRRGSNIFLAMDLEE